VEDGKHDFELAGKRMGTTVLCKRCGHPMWEINQKNLRCLEDHEVAAFKAMRNIKRKDKL
jgi:hypothetical protein